MKRTKNLGNIIKILPEFKTALLANANLRKMLFYSSTDALSKNAPSIEDVSELITFQPLAESGIKNFGKHTYIVIDIDLIDLEIDDDSSILTNVDIAAITQFDTGLLDDNKIRLLEICNEIITAIDGIKFSSSGAADIGEVRRVTINEQSNSYVCRVIVGDDTTKEGF